MSRFTQALQGGAALFRQEFGTAIKRLATTTRAESTITGVVHPLATSDFPALSPEGGAGFQPNVYELNPLMVTKLPVTCDWRPNDYLIYPATGDSLKDRYRVESVQPIYINNVLVYHNSLIFASPDVE